MWSLLPSIWATGKNTAMGLGVREFDKTIVGSIVSQILYCGPTSLRSRWLCQAGCNCLFANKSTVLGRIRVQRCAQMCPTWTNTSCLKSGGTTSIGSMASCALDINQDQSQELIMHVWQPYLYWCSTRTCIECSKVWLGPLRSHCMWGLRACV